MDWFCNTKTLAPGIKDSMTTVDELVRRVGAIAVLA